MIGGRLRWRRCLRWCRVWTRSCGVWVTRTRRWSGIEVAETIPRNRGDFDHVILALLILAVSGDRCAAPITGAGPGLPALAAPGAAEVSGVKGRPVGRSPRRRVSAL